MPDPSDPRWLRDPFTGLHSFAATIVQADLQLSTTARVLLEDADHYLVALAIVPVPLAVNDRIHVADRVLRVIDPASAESTPDEHAVVCEQVS